MNNTINIWDDPDYPWGEDLSRDLYKIEYDERKKREQGAERAGIALPGTHQSSSEMADRMAQLASNSNSSNQIPMNAFNSSSSRAIESQFNKSILDRADEAVQVGTPFSAKAKPGTTVSLKDNQDARFSLNPLLNTSPEQQAYDHYLSGSGRDIELTETMFIDAAKHAEKKLGSNIADGRHAVSFYDSNKFGGMLGTATVHVRNGKVIGIEDRYDFDKKDWGERNYFHELATRIGHDPNGAPFNVYGGRVSKKY